MAKPNIEHPALGWEPESHYIVDYSVDESGIKRGMLYSGILTERTATSKPIPGRYNSLFNATTSHFPDEFADLIYLKVLCKIANMDIDDKSPCLDNSVSESDGKPDVGHQSLYRETDY